MDESLKLEVCTDSDDDKSLIQFIQIKKKKTVVKKIPVEKLDSPKEAVNEPLKAEKKSKSTKNNQFKCSDCEKLGITRIFKIKDRLQAHITSRHCEESKKPVFLCDVCNAAQKPIMFSVKKTFMAHMMYQHSVVVFICDICTAIFKLKANYKTHMAKHNVRPKKEFKCDTCNGSFVNKAGYVSHQKRFPGPHIKQVCPHCGTSFSRERHMQNHRCKTLLLKAAKERAENVTTEEKEISQEVTLVSTDGQVHYQPVEVSVANPVTIQELQEAPEQEQVIMAGNLLPGAQVLHIEIGDPDQTQQVYQVNVADWNMVAPYVVRDHPANAKDEQSSSE